MRHGRHARWWGGLDAGIIERCCGNGTMQVTVRAMLMEGKDAVTKDG